MPGIWNSLDLEYLDRARKFVIYEFVGPDLCSHPAVLQPLLLDLMIPPLTSAVVQSRYGETQVRHPAWRLSPSDFTGVVLVAWRHALALPPSTNDFLSSLDQPLER